MTIQNERRRATEVFAYYFGITRRERGEYGFLVVSVGQFDSINITSNITSCDVCAGTVMFLVALDINCLTAVGRDRHVIVVPRLGVDPSTEVECEPAWTQSDSSQRHYIHVEDPRSFGGKVQDLAGVSKSDGATPECFLTEQHPSVVLPKSALDPPSIASRRNSA